MRDAPTDPTTRDVEITDIPDGPMPDPNDPTEGQPDMNLPGADTHNPVPDGDAELPQRLGERMNDGPGLSGAAAGHTDLLPNVEVPEAQM